MLTIFILFAFIILFLFFSAFFSASETALYSIPRERILFFQNDKRRAHQWVYALLRDGQKTLLTILLGNIFVNITVAGLIHTVLGHFPGSSSIVTLLVATTIIVIFGEMLPKNIALKNNEFIALLISPYLYSLKIVFSPLSKSIQSLNQFFLSRFKERLRQPSPYITVEELKTGVMQSARDGAIAPQEQDMIISILDQGAQAVRKVMTHRSRVLVLSGRMTVHEAREKMSQKSELLALVRDPADSRHLAGFIRLSNLLSLADTALVASIAVAPVWVPETMEVADLMSFFFNEGHTEACVLDEFGCFSGIFSVSTGLKRILDFAAPRPLRHSGNTGQTMVFSGLQDVESIVDWLPPSLRSSAKDVRTLNGLLTNHLGKIPKTGDKFAIDGWNFYIMSSSPTLIESVLIRKRDSV